ncbi:plant virulence effector HPE1-like domain-containing protein [Rhizobium sp. NPDC090279]|uniref:plant virulence effector HPE1-like domain-containing protein n=1 Tax=Rhizobium sp. NPDC090279 TaxID=3364499 RepID=UPI00383B4956
MRSFFLTLACVLAGGSATASSIQPVDGTMIGGRGSIVDKSCAECPPLKPKVTEREYTVPTLTAGTQSIVVRNVDGEKKVLRTEAWMGGSPVVFVSKPTPEALAAAGEPADGIDMAAKTAALPEPAPLDLSGFQLRQ